MSTSDLASLVKRLEKVADKLEKCSSGSGGSSSQPVEAGEAVKAFDDYVAESLTPFLKLSRKIGGDLDAMTDLVEKAFNEVRNVIDVASKSKKPDNTAYGALVKPVSDVCKEAADYRNSKRRTPLFNHLSGLADGLKLVLWVAVPNTPVPYVKEMVEAARFYHIKVLVEYKNKEGGELHKNWVNAFKDAGNALADYVKTHHTTGLKFNPKGSSSLSKPTTSAPKKKVVQVKKVTKGNPRGNLFAELNKGGKITSGLKKVKKEQKTKYQTGPKVKVAFKSKAKKVKRITGKPIIELVRGSKWAVENHDGNKKVEVTIQKIKETVYIYKCDNSNIIVKGKCNSISMDNCVKSNLIFDDCVSSVDLINCKSVKVQVLGSVPTIQVDKTDGFNCFLNEKSLHTTFVTSKSSEMNVSVPSGDNDYKEHPVPEQFVTSYKNGKFNTQVSGHF